MKIKSIFDYTDKELSKFNSGNEYLDTFFSSHAKRNDESGYGKTFVLDDENKILGFFTLCSAQIKFDSYPGQLQNLLPRYPIPCIRIARLAVKSDLQGKGLGKLMLKEAFLRIANASKTVGIHLVIVDAKEQSASFYEHFGFKKLLDKKLSYYLPLNTIIKAMTT